MVADDRVAVVHVVARLVEDGQPGPVFETTDVDVALASDAYDAHRDYEPLEFRVGAGEVVPALDEVVQQLAVGEERTVIVEPERAFGPREDARVVEVDRSALESRSDVPAAVDELVGTADGQVGWITAVGEETVTVDFNHELAGRSVAFEVRLLDVREAADGAADAGDGDEGRGGEGDAADD